MKKTLSFKKFKEFVMEVSSPLKAFESSLEFEVKKIEHLLSRGDRVFTVPIEYQGEILSLYRDAGWYADILGGKLYLLDISYRDYILKEVRNILGNEKPLNLLWLYLIREAYPLEWGQTILPLLQIRFSIPTKAIASPYELGILVEILQGSPENLTLRRADDFLEDWIFHKPSLRNIKRVCVQEGSGKLLPYIELKGDDIDLLEVYDGGWDNNFSFLKLETLVIECKEDLFHKSQDALANTFFPNLKRIVFEGEVSVEPFLLKMKARNVEALQNIGVLRTAHESEVTAFVKTKFDAQESFIAKSFHPSLHFTWEFSNSMEEVARFKSILSGEHL